jgi:hypothetical protein
MRARCSAQARCSFQVFNQCSFGCCRAGAGLPTFHFHTLHRWSADEVGHYLDYLRAEREARTGGTWRVDLRWLQGQGVHVPEGVPDEYYDD